MGLAEPCNNCAATANAEVNEPNQITANTTPIHILCNGAATGVITVNANGRMHRSCSAKNAASKVWPGAGTNAIERPTKIAIETEWRLICQRLGR